MSLNSYGENKIFFLIKEMYREDPKTPITLQDLYEPLASFYTEQDVKDKVGSLISKGKVRLVEGGILLKEMSL